MNDKVAEFARLLVENVRDKAIQSCDGLVASLNNETKSVISKRWSDVRSREGETAFLQAVVADGVALRTFRVRNMKLGSQ